MKNIHTFVAILVLAFSATILCAGMGFGFGASNASKSGP